MRASSKMTLAILLLCSIGVVPLSCTSETDSAANLEEQTVAVQRGDLVVEVTAAGNLELSHTEDLAFDISGTVGEVMVEEGDYVEKGQSVATLGTSDWEDEISSLERQLRSTERDLLQAEISLENAEDALEEAEEETTTTVTGDIVRREIDSREIDMRELEIELAELRLEDARIALRDAQEDLDEAKSKSPLVIAPFDGFIVSVNVEGGDEVLEGTIAVVLADPSMFQASLMVSEMDIFQIEVGGEAWVEVDAVSGLRLPASVVHISPTATIQSGVVNYEVEVEVKSLEAVMQERRETREAAPSEELPERIQQAIEEGEITQEQAEEMMNRMQQAQGPRQEQAPAMLSEDFQLREGLTVTVSIVVEERSDVLLVPNGAITSRGQRSYVQVVSPDGTTEERSIQTGISDWQYTEVTDGLSEGEEILVSGGTATATAATQQQDRRGGIMIPGLGGPPR
jgi:HlyD family secretion protein